MNPSKYHSPTIIFRRPIDPLKKQLSTRTIDVVGLHTDFYSA